MAHRAQAQIYTWGRGESKSHEAAGWGGSISGLRILLRWKQRSAISGRRQKILAERGTGGILLGEAGQNTVHTAEAQRTRHAGCHACTRRTENTAAPTQARH